MINGGAGDDAFEYFRCWLIARGRDVFEAAVADPETLADALPSGFQGEADFEELAYVAGDLWSEKTGRKVSELPSTGAPLPPEPSGVPFEEDAADLARRYPKLWARFGF